MCVCHSTRVTSQQHPASPCLNSHPYQTSREPARLATTQAPAVKLSLTATCPHATSRLSSQNNSMQSPSSACHGGKACQVRPPPSHYPSGDCHPAPPCAWCISHTRCPLPGPPAAVQSSARRQAPQTHSMHCLSHTAALLCALAAAAQPQLKRPCGTWEGPSSPAAVAPAFPTPLTLPHPPATARLLHLPRSRPST